MKYSGITRLVLVVVLAIASYELSRGVINPFSYDIFETCISSTSLEPSKLCEWGPQVMVNGLAGIIFFFTGLLLLVRGTKLMKPISLAAMALTYVILRLAFWRFDQQLNDNFAGLYQGTGPATVTEYLYLLYVSNNAVVMGVILAGFYNIAETRNKFSIDEAKRKLPRIVTVAKGKKSQAKVSLRNLFKR